MKENWLEVKISPVKALFWIVLSMLVISGACYSFFRNYVQYKKNLAIEGPAVLQILVQTGPEKEALTSVYLCELMNLSMDKPLEFAKCNPKNLERQLLASPLIEKANIKLVKPHTVYVDYTLRTPIAEVFDYPNTFIDPGGHLFPYRPFFSPKKLPQVYFGQEEFPGWHVPLLGRNFELAKEVIKCLQQDEFSSLIIKRVDVSMAFAPSCGKRELVMELEEEKVKNTSHEVFPIFLRLSPKDYRQELANYLQLREEFLKKEIANLEGTHVHPVKIIDFRIPQLAFIQEEEQK